MAGTILKEVRIRPEIEGKVPGLLDVKLTVSDVGTQYELVSKYLNLKIDDNVKLVNKTQFGKQKTVDEVIDDYLDEEYIAQDPFETKSVYYRPIGLESYNLINGASVYIFLYDAKTNKRVFSKPFTESWSDRSGFELESLSGTFSKTDYYKVAKLKSSGPDGQMNYDGFIKPGPWPSSSQSPGKTFSAQILDIEILSELISTWKAKVGEYDLKLYNPTIEPVSNWSSKGQKYSNFANFVTDDINVTLEYKSPIKTVEQTPVQEEPKSSVQKLKLNVQLPKSLKVQSREDLPTIKVWVGDPKPESTNTTNNTDLPQEMGDEYQEDAFVGQDETTLSKEEWLEQDKSSVQEDSSKPVDPALYGPPADVKPVSSFDALINLAGKCARELGKNARVNAENMKKGYVNGIHGLCPQGTQAVLYALTGIKALGQLSGNADWFSFKSPTQPPGGDSRGDFSKTGYYSPKVKISQKSGSWKGTYLNDKTQWQVGDIIAMGYSGGKLYGHIQVWTGYCWMSDFKQNAIQQNHVDPESVALWRLNSNGLAAVQKQNQSNLA